MPEFTHSTELTDKPLPADPDVYGTQVRTTSEQHPPEHYAHVPICAQDGCTREATHAFDTTISAISHGGYAARVDARSTIHHLVCADHTDMVHFHAKPGFYPFGLLEIDAAYDERLEYGPEELQPCPHCGRWATSWRLVTTDGVDGCLGCLSSPDAKRAP